MAVGDPRYNPDGGEEVVHACPPEGSGAMPCCGRTPLEVPRYHRLTLDPALVTCRPSESRLSAKEYGQ